MQVNKPNYRKRQRSSIGASFLLGTLLCCFLSFTATAQQELARHYKKYDLTLQSKGIQKNDTQEPVSYTISEKEASWLRLFFDNINLGKKSSITITSNLDGASQVLTASTIKTWKNTSAYFNGNSVTITLNTAPGEKAVGLKIVEVGIGDLKATTKSQCGSQDNRTDSNDAAIGRIVPIGCTGWIITNGKIVTAGHCTGSRAQVLEFNVPKSNPNGSIIHPGPEDQYPIGSFITNYVRGDPTTDWAVGTLGVNSQTGLTAIDAQGKSFNVVQRSPGNTIRITGFGTDTGIDNQTQQTHTGPTVEASSTLVRYQTDTEGGNSGSPIVDEASGNAVGVHAYGGCRTSGTGNNYGARATIADFWEALDLGGTPPPGDCETIDFSDFTISPFSTQDASGNYSVTNTGASLELQNNTWKYIAYDYNVTPNTMIEFNFSSTSQGEIHAVGFENDNSLTQSMYFRVYGTQNYGLGNYDDYPGSGTKTYVIPVGSFYTGNMSRLVFINDNDFGNGNNSVFSNVKIYEGSCSGSATTAILNAKLEAAAPILGNENEGLLAEVDINPNPTTDNFSITLDKTVTNATGTVYSVFGEKIQYLQLSGGLNQFSNTKLSLQPGTYLLKIESKGEIVTKRLIIK